MRIYHKHVSKRFVAVSLRREILTTAGSTKAVQSSPSSKRAKTNEIAAEPRRMRTSWSLNCSRTSFQRGVASSSSRAKRIVSRESFFHDRSSFSNRTDHVRRSESKKRLTIRTVLLAQAQDLLLRQACLLRNTKVAE